MLVYMDDLLIPSTMVQEGLNLLDSILRLVYQVGLKLKMTKCAFLMTEIEYLRHEISSGSVRAERREVRANFRFQKTCMA